MMTAFTNMMKVAVRDPVWFLLAPLKMGKRMMRAVVSIAIATMIVMLAGKFALDTFGFAKGSMPWLALNLFSLLLPLVLIYRQLSSALILHFGTSTDHPYGSARFASSREIAPLTKSQSGLLIGRDPKSRKLLRYDGPAHLLTIAPTRSGKGVGTIIPNLLTAQRSIICIDPKGENASVTGSARRQFGGVHVLDPFNITETDTSAFNPLDAMDTNNIDIGEDLSTLADALVFDEPGKTGEAHWNEEAKALITGMLLMIVASEPPARRHLMTLREYLTFSPSQFADLLSQMQNRNDANGLIARAANRHLGKPDREAASVLSNAQRHTHFLDSPRMGTVLKRSDFRFGDLKDRCATIFLVLPPDRLSTYSRWLRLMISESLRDMARTRTTSSSNTPVLYLLDEFASLGHLASVERAMGLMAGYGVQLWPILQDIHQLRDTYGKRAGTFLSNSGVLQVFGVNDYGTAEVVSDLLGQETILFQAMGRSLDPATSSISFNEQHRGRPLLTPDEVRNMPNSSQLLFLAGQRPIIGKKLVYYADAEFREFLKYT